MADPAALPAWMLDAECAGMVGAFDGDDPELTATAVRVCAGCAVAAPCGAYGLATGGTGVWGGLRLRFGLRLPLVVVQDDEDDEDDDERAA